MHIYTSATISIPRDQSLTELLHTTASPAIPDSHLIAKDSLTNRSITLGELRDRAGRIANGLVTRLNPPDQARWALSLPNSVEFVEAAHAILWTGGVICPINHALKPTEIGHGLTVSQPQFIIAYGPTLPAILEAVDIATADLTSQGIQWSRPRIMTMVAGPSSPKSSMMHPYSSIPHIPDDGFLLPTKLAIPHYSDTTTRLATIHLSSGTTGKPKGVELTHYNFVANVHQLVAHDHHTPFSNNPNDSNSTTGGKPKNHFFNPSARQVAFTPMVHIGMTTLPLFLGPYTGMLHHCMPSYNLEKFAQLCGSDRATSFAGVPSVVLSLANTDVTERYDFSQAQVINVGGAPLSDEVKKRLYSRAGWKLNQVYGMSEAAGYVAYQKMGEDVGEGVVGGLLPGIEACLKIEGTDKDAPKGGAGELWIRGPNITRGYVGVEGGGKNFAIFEGGGDGGQWYNTGDVCKVDMMGRVSVVGRTKELIKYKGFQVSPAELEPYVNGHPDVVEGGVGAIWDESQLTELPTAWVVLKESVAKLGDKGRRDVLKGIQEGIDKKVSGYKKLRGGVWEIQALPKNPTGKILRKKMAEMTDGLCSIDQGAMKAKL